MRTQILEKGIPQEIYDFIKPLLVELLKKKTYFIDSCLKYLKSNKLEISFSEVLRTENFASREQKSASALEEYSTYTSPSM
jgi:hypothetical protein